MQRRVLDKVMNISSTVLKTAGYRCIEAEWDARERVVRIFVDYREDHLGDGDALNGDDFNMEDCVHASKVLNDHPELDAELDMAIRGSYRFEVSSPGIERPLRLAEDFRQRVGESVQVWMRGANRGRRCVAKVLAVEDASPAEDGPWLVVEREAGPLRLSLSSISKARVVVDWSKVDS